MTPKVTPTEVVGSTSPPLIVSSLSFMGVGLQEWVYIVTITYTVMQIGRLLIKSYRSWKEG
jgi:hypothetical protein